MIIQTSEMPSTKKESGATASTCQATGDLRRMEGPLLNVLENINMTDVHENVKIGVA